METVSKLKLVLCSQQCLQVNIQTDIGITKSKNKATNTIRNAEA